MSTAPSSLEQAFRGATEGGAVLGADADATQLDLLRDPKTGRLPSNVFQLVRRGEARRGRPRGAGNKRNEKLAKLITHNHGDPVMFMASVYAMPLDQVVELLRLADDAAEREERLLTLADQVEQHVAQMAEAGVASGKKLEAVERLVDRLSDIAKVLRSTPGDLAVRALALQVQAARATAEYVHGKQPVAVSVTGKADMVLLVPGLNAPAGMDPKALQDAVTQGGLESIDFEGMKLIEGAGPDDADDDGVND
ncbi:hypothetical protein ACMT1E_04385 [Sphingomonas flavalba]|uniref:hypothetical protein n=1 Tax=Sphingomonas flavalba TaxID=2559804 RepID=UPI0039E1901A